MSNTNNRNNTQSKIHGIISINLVLIFCIGIFSGCSKNSGDDTLASISINKTATVTASSLKATEKSPVTTSKTDVSASSTSIISNNIENVLQEGESTSGTDVSSVPETESNNPIDVSSVEFTAGETFAQNMNIDMGGKTITYIANVATNLWGDEADKRMEYRTLYRRLQKAEKLYNFKLDQKLIARGVFTKEIVDSTMAGLKYTDIFLYDTGADMPKFINYKIVLPLSDYIDYELPVVKANSFLYNSSLWKGKHYGYSPIYEYAFANCFFNNIILNREGQPDILDLVESKQWTWEKMLEIASNCTKDLNGDGIIDQWGLTAGGLSAFFNQLLYSNGATFLDISGDDITYGLESGPALRALQFGVDLLYTHKVAISYPNNGPAIYKAEKAAFCLDSYFMNNQYIVAGLESMLAPLPMGPDVDNYQNIYPPALYGISSLCDNPLEVSRIICDIMTLWDENLEPIQEYQEVRDIYGADYLWSSGNVVRRMLTEREFIVSYKPLYSSFKPDFSNGFPGMATLVSGQIYLKIANAAGGNVSVAQAVSNIESQVQDIINQNK